MLSYKGTLFSGNLKQKQTAVVSFEPRVADTLVVLAFAKQRARVRAQRRARNQGTY